MARLTRRLEQRYNELVLIEERLDEATRLEEQANKQLCRMSEMENEASEKLARASGVMTRLLEDLDSI